jgi:serine/threonine-protein kinase
LAIELDSTLVDGYTHFARLRGFQGHHAEAVRILEHAVARSGRRAVEVGFLGHAYARAGRPDDAKRILAELEARRSEGTATPLAVAFVEIGLGDYDDAFKSLELARRTGDMWLTENNADLVFDPLRGDPRWSRLMKRMGVAATPI